MLECKKISDINQLGFLCNGFSKDWLEPCCSDHKSMLVDFALTSLLSNFKDEYKENTVYSRLLKKFIEVIRQQNLPLDRQLEYEMLDQILAFITHRDDKIAFGGVEILEKYLKLHEDRCNGCCNADCDHLNFIQRKFSTNQSVRIKIKPSLTRCLLTFSRNWKPTFQQISEHYDALDSVIGQNQAAALIILLLEKFPSDRSAHILLLNKAISDSSTPTFLVIVNRFLPYLFKQSQLRAWFLDSYDQICDKIDTLATLKICLLVLEHNTSTNAHWSEFIEERKLVFALLHSDESIRIMAFRLLCFNHKMGNEIQLKDLKLVEAFLLTNIPVHLPTLRTEICANLKKFLNRIAVNVQVRRKNGALEQDLLKSFCTFLSTIHTHAVDSLLSDAANFNRRVTSLMLLKLLHVSGIFLTENQDDSLYKLLGLYDLTKEPRFLESLFKNVDYSYDLVQTLSLDLIQKIDFEIDERTKTKFVDDLIVNADSISTDIQHRVAFQAKIVGVKFPDKVTYILDEISSKCRQRINNASLNLITFEQPVHTFLNAASSVIPFVSFEDPKLVSYLRQNVIKLCMDVAKIVDPVLQSISPEGMLYKEDLNQQLELQADRHVPELIFEQKYESQTLLVGCWRTLKAISSIFASVIELAPDDLLLGEWKDLLPDFKLYFWTQLTLCRHRGVFELAGKGFQIICDRYSKLFADDQNNQLNPLSWLHEILIAVRGGVDPQFLCSTRRSAGLPYLIVAILKSYQPNAINKYGINIHLDRTFDTLFDCRSLDPVFEIHCVNVLKVLLHNTIYRKQIVKQLEKALLLTLNGLNSTNWSIRNSYSQLFSVLVMRIFGTDCFNQVGFGISLLEFKTSFPRAFDELLKMLDCFDPNCETSEQIVQPILVIFSHLRASAFRSETKTQELLATIHLIAFNAKRDIVRTLAVQSITSILHAESLFEHYFDFYERLIRNADRLSTNALTSLFQLFGNIIEKTQDLTNTSKLVSVFNFMFENKFDILSRNDYTVSQFLRTVKISIERGFSFEFGHLFLNLKLKYGQFAASNPMLSQLYMDFCQAQNIQVNFDQLPNDFALHCLEKLLLDKRDLNSIDITSLLKEAKTRRNFTLIRRIMDLLADHDLMLLDNLIGEVDFMTEHELFLINLNLNLLRKTHMSKEQWTRVDEIAQDCTPDIALRILQLIEKVVSTGEMSESIEKRIAFFLQNEEPNIRKKAASIISSILCPKMENNLHSIACWAMEVKKYPELLTTVEKLSEQTLSSDIGLSTEVYEVDKEKRIFATIAKNCFVETFLLPKEIEATEFLLHSLLFVVDP